ncbi:radical SAM family protein [Caballeronia fortuita]|uniref:Radical SAM family protein n=1 Tax=Caballeronia fortuita TaxID=1777138 RepID=A0A158B246_9BURK|nr:anaerobic sulfatase maturase [Caballeronia fortuita]SAK63357.1 radical SAM family protein [Caballeronia fortuita]
MKQSTFVPLAPLSTSRGDEQAPPSGARFKRRFHVMAKPTGSACNLDCTYCFYLHKEALLEQRRGKFMSDRTLETFIQQYIEAQDGESIVFSWQGGEPTLMGLDFFRRVVELQAKYAPSGQRIENNLQTNGVALTDDWCIFLNENNWLVGLSIDGPRDLHDAYRVSRSGKPTFYQVMRAVERIHSHGVNFNALTVVNRINARRPVDVYRFLTREIGATYVQFNPCVEPRTFRNVAPQFWDDATIPEVGSARARPGGEDSIVTDWSVDPDDWGYFLTRTFDEWYRHDLGRVLVNLFETAVAQTLGMPSQLCITAPFCGKGLAMEHDGRVYSCDHYVYPEYELSDIFDRPLNEIAFSERQKVFGFAKKDTLPKYCRECSHLNLCWGECPKNRIVRAPDGETGLNYLCPGIRAFHAHAGPRLRQIARSIAPSSAG